MEIIPAMDLFGMILMGFTWIMFIVSTVLMLIDKE